MIMVIVMNLINVKVTVIVMVKHMVIVTAVTAAIAVGFSSTSQLFTPLILFEPVVKAY
jgi:hypothetical protein